MRVVAGAAIAVIIAAADSPDLTLIYVGAFGALITSIATAVGMILSARDTKARLKLAQDEADANRLHADEAAEALERSTSFVELEKALPGLGLLVDRWQKEATAEHDLRVAGQEKAMADHQLILRLQDEVSTLQAKLARSEAKNIELERRVQFLERQKETP